MKLNSVNSAPLLCVILFSIVFYLPALANPYSAESSYAFSLDKIKIEGNLGTFTPSLEMADAGMDRYLFKLNLHSASPAAPPQFRIRVNFPGRT